MYLCIFMLIYLQRFVCYTHAYIYIYMYIHTGIHMHVEVYTYIHAPMKLHGTVKHLPAQSPTGSSAGRRPCPGGAPASFFSCLGVGHDHDDAEDTDDDEEKEEAYMACEYYFPFVVEEHRPFYRVPGKARLGCKGALKTKTTSVHGVHACTPRLLCRFKKTTTTAMGRMIFLVHPQHLTQYTLHHDMCLPQDRR